MTIIFSDSKDRETPRKSRMGFTAVEIMVVAMLLGIIGSFAVISARSMFPRMRVDRASSRLAFQLQLARSEAIANNQSVRIWLDPSTHVLRVWVDQNRDGVEDESEMTRVLLAPTDEVNLSSTWEAALFNAYGQFITVPGQRVMQTETTTIVSPDGRHSIELTIRGSGAITKR